MQLPVRVDLIRSLLVLETHLSAETAVEKFDRLRSEGWYLGEVQLWCTEGASYWPLELSFWKGVVGCIESVTINCEVSALMWVTHLESFSELPAAYIV